MSGSFVQGDWCDEAGWFECKHGTVNLIEKGLGRVTYDKPRNTGTSHCPHDDKIGLNLPGFEFLARI